jgi:hypothetical protein
MKFIFKKLSLKVHNIESFWLVIKFRFYKLKNVTIYVYYFPQNGRKITLCIKPYMFIQRRNNDRCYLKNYAETQNKIIFLSSYTLKMPFK